jgi:F0F1-type ATP synthase assembly protein I
VPPETQDDERTGAGSLARALKEAGPYLSIGTALAATVLLGVGAGYWVDRRWGTKPVFLLIGGTLGVFTALFQFFKTVGRRQ